MANSSNRVLTADAIEGINIFRNYIKNSTAQDNTNGWATYADAAGTRPVDGTGGSPNVTFSRTTTNPLSLDGSFQFVKDAVNRQGQGTSYDFTIDRADRARILQIEFDYEVVSGTFVGSATVGTDSDLIVYLYDVTNAALIEPAGILLDGSVAGQQYRYRGVFQTSSSSTSYRLILHCATTSASTYTVNFDNFRVSRQVIPNGAVVTDWQSYTPTLTGITLGSGSSSRWFWRRVGDKMEISGGIVFGTGLSLSGTNTFSIPTGYSIDYLKVSGNNSSGAFAAVGHGRAYDASAGLNYNITSFTSSTSSTNIRFGSAGAGSTEITSTSPFTWAVSDEYHILVSVPISGWSSNVQMSNDTDTRVVAMSARKTANQTSIGTTPVQITYTTVDQDTHNALSSSTYTIPVAGTYDVSAFISWSTVNQTSGDRLDMYIYKNGAEISRSAAVYAGNITTQQVNKILDLKAGDTIAIYAATATAGSGTRTIDGTNDSYWNGFNIKRLSGPSVVAATETIALRASRETSAQSLTTSGTTVIVFNSITATGDYDSHGAYNTSTGVYTVPVSGKYKVFYRLQLAAGGTYSSSQAYVRKNGSGRWATDYGPNSVNTLNQWYVFGADTINCVAGDTLDLIYVAGTQTGITMQNGSSQSYITIERVGN